METELSFGSRLKHAWNAFLNRDPPRNFGEYAGGYSYRPDRVRLTRGNERTETVEIRCVKSIDFRAESAENV